MTNIAPPLSGKTILVVDDEDDLRRVIAFDFKRQGCKVLEANCGNVAIEILKKSHVDAVISDVRMPNGTGVDLLEHVRAVNSKVPVVLLITGYADITKEEAERRGAQELLDKPIDRKKMIAVVEQCLNHDQ